MRSAPRPILLLACLVSLFLPGAWAGVESVESTIVAADTTPLVIVLEHHWVTEIFGQRFGLIQFDTPMTMILLGGVHVDVPAPVSAVLLPLLAVPLLIAAGFAWQQQRRARQAFGNHPRAACSTVAS